MKKISSLIIVLCLTCSCGGSGGSDDNQNLPDPYLTMLGNWSGRLIQASGITCSDGTFIGAGTGTDFGQVNISLTQPNFNATERLLDGRDYYQLNYQASFECPESEDCQNNPTEECIFIEDLDSESSREEQEYFDEASETTIVGKVMKFVPLDVSTGDCNNFSSARILIKGATLSLQAIPNPPTQHCTFTRGSELSPN